jgi:hypothetical protein
MRYLELSDVPLGAPLPGFIYATRLGYTSVLVEYGLEPSFFVSKSISESLFRSTSLMGRTRYTNPWVPEGHTHVSSPRDSIRVADSGWVSKLQSLTSFNLRLLQSSTSSIFDFFNLWFLQFFYFFNFRLHQTSTSWKLSFLQFSTSILQLPEIFGLLNLLSRWE